MSLRILIRLLCLSSFCIATLAPLPSWAEDWIYTLRPGDKLWNLAKDYCGSGTLAEAIAQHNGLTDSTRLRAGQRLKIPVNWLVFAPAHAEFIEASGDIIIIRDVSRTQASTEARSGVRLYMGDKVVTQEGAALVQFADNSTLAIQPHSQILFNKLTAFGPAGMVDTHLRFSYGRGNAKVTPQNQGDRFRIQTPEGIAAVRGTIFRVNHRLVGDQSVSNSETLEGAVVFMQATRNTELPAGFGVAVSVAGAIKEQLLPAPDLQDQNANVSTDATIQWQPVIGAAHYLVSWANAKSPEIVISQIQQPSPSTRVVVPPGEYLLSLRGVSAAGIEGFDATTQLTVGVPPPTITPVLSKVAGSIEFNWDPTSADQAYTLSVINTDTNQLQSILVQGRRHAMSLPAGRYAWYLTTERNLQTPTESFQLLPASPSHLSARSHNKNIHVSWEPAPDVNSYELIITRPDGNSDNIIVEGTETDIPAPEYGTYKITLASVHNTLHSESQDVQVQVYKRHWWLIATLSLLAL